MNPILIESKSPPYFRFDASALREPVPTSLENALAWLESTMETKPAPQGRRRGASHDEHSGTGVQDRDGATVLGPAGNVVADRDRAFLAVGYRPHPALIDA